MNAHVTPVQVNVLQDRETTKRHRVPWTPTFVFLDGNGVEQHRFIGFLPPDEFAAQLHLARARDAFAKGQYDDALRRYAQIVERYAATDAAPESLYWTGVCEFKRTKDTEKILAKGREVVKRYPNHIWAKKLSYLKS